MILLYQLVHRNSDSSLLDLFLSASVITTRGHNFKNFKHAVTFVTVRTFSPIPNN